MPRQRPPDRFDRILDAAMRVFARTGLERTKMSEIAAEAGVSHGTLYNYVESKEALFRLLLDRGLGGKPPKASDLPVRGPGAAALAQRMEQAISTTFALPKLDEAMHRKKVSDAAAELGAIVDELFERTVATREAADALERSARDVPELALAFYVGARQGLLDRLEHLICARVRSGQYRKTNPPILARMIIENVTTFGRHIYGDPGPVNFDLEAARTIVRDTIVAGVVAHRSA
jgi:AcrR family transcriptional regulator